MNNSKVEELLSGMEAIVSQLEAVEHGPAIRPQVRYAVLSWDFCQKSQDVDLAIGNIIDIETIKRFEMVLLNYTKLSDDYLSDLKQKNIHVKRILKVNRNCQRRLLFSQASLRRVNAIRDKFLSRGAKDGQRETAEVANGN